MALTLDTIPELAAARARPVPLDAITADDDVQPRLAVGEDAIRRYKDALRNSPKALPPILLADLGTMRDTPLGKVPTLTVVDGYHRFKAHQELRMKRIMAKTIRCGPGRVKWLAALANMAHGLPLKRGDQREVFRRYVKAGENRGPDGGPKSHREIVEDLGGMRALGTVHGWMQKDFPEIAAEMAERDGPLEAEAPRETKLSYAQAKLKEYCLATTRAARWAVQEGKEGEGRRRGMGLVL